MLGPQFGGRGIVFEPVSTSILFGFPVHTRLQPAISMSFFGSTLKANAFWSDEKTLQKTISIFYQSTSAAVTNSEVHRKMDMHSLLLVLKELQ